MIKSFFTAALLCAALAGRALGAPAFELEAGVRLSSAEVHCVAPISGGYRLYFSTPSHYAVFSASSTDGLAWTVEPGIRLSTQTAGYDASSVTALGVYSDASLAGGPYRMYYVGVSTNGYALLSAKSADGLAWNKDGGFKLSFSGGGARLRSPKPHFAGLGKVYLYYVRDSGGAPDPGAQKAYVIKSTDSGNTFAEESLLLDTTGVYHLDVSTLTDGRVRLFVAAAEVNSSTASRVLAADSATGLTFSAGAAQVFSTAAASNEITAMAVARSTDAYSWRLYLTSRLNQAATSYVYSALTKAPVITSFSPNLAYDSDGPSDFTVSGEVFAPGLNTVALSGASASLAIVSVTRVSDMRLTVRAVPTAAPLGAYSVTAANPDGRSATLANALTIDYRHGVTALTDNLFRPLRGGRVRADVTIFAPGRIKADVYTINGGLVKKLFDGQAPTGTTTFFWSGDTDDGRTAASGLYLLQVTGPKLKGASKIVLLK